MQVYSYTEVKRRKARPRDTAPSFRDRERPQKARKKRYREEPKWVQVSSTSWRHCLPRAIGAEQPASSAWVIWGAHMRHHANL